MNGARKKPDLLIRASVARGDDGWFPFGGVMTTSGGEYVATVRGRFPPEFFRMKPARRRGAPKNLPRKIAICLHERMAFCEIEETGESKTSARVRAARAMHLGGADERETAKYIRDHAKHETVKAALDGFPGVMTFAGDQGVEGRLAIAFRRDAVVEWAGHGVRVKGRVWICQWGDRVASYGNMDCLIPIENPVSKIAERIEVVMKSKEGE